MNIRGLDAEAEGRELGIGGVENIVTNAERICIYEAQRIELTNESVIVGLSAQYRLLADEERRLEERLRFAPPPGDLRRLHRRRIYYWLLTILLTAASFAFALFSFAPFNLGWKAWLYCGGIAAVTPFLVEKFLDDPRMERLVKMLTASAAIASLAGLMILAVIRGNLLAEQFRSQNAQPVVLDDQSAPQPQPPQNDFYNSTLGLLRLTLLLFAFAMELGAGLALHEAWRAVPDGSEDWDKLRASLAEVRQGMAEIASQATMLRNEPAIFTKRFWRDFYRGLLTNAARSAMTKLLLYILMAGFFCSGIHAQVNARLNLVVAVDLTQSVAATGPDSKNDFQKNIDGVARLFAQVPAGARVAVVGITDTSFTQPYILLRAHVPDDPGYFGERLNAARGELVAAWKGRSTRLDPQYPRTDIFGALLVAGQFFADGSKPATNMLVIFSDMREDTPELDLESARTVQLFNMLASQCGAIPDLNDVQVYVLGADGAGKSISYWQSLAAFWRAYFQRTGADLREFSAMRELPEEMSTLKEQVGR